MSTQPIFRVMGRVSIQPPAELNQEGVVMEGELTLPFAPFPGLVLQGKESGVPRGEWTLQVERVVWEMEQGRFKVDCQRIIVHNGTWGFDIDTLDLVRSNGAYLGYVVDGMASRLERAGWRKVR
ncbi:hypothetical protein ATI61_106542 [Archangium gephyra]|uniref:Uncharacterized protein n=2 Tax=Archangium gephyra TaxID=48 RepID=A0ABX9K1B6_9BACT|nr:hypothetical protein [Archangium gephyra]REG31072.1 hypothetical protein ATI61_106542 [Archangium gephyra]